ncbi:MAG: metal ABC transporter ATP-binding protein [Planctomycetes bacterium]|nr:metal ABC transporter ATP-binding protein [Planctomycetota bacterium]
MEDADCLLKVEKLSLAYGHNRVLADVNLEVRRGQIWFFAGPNGSGKSTLLKGILGALRPKSGALWLSPELSSREKVGYVPQRCDLNPTLPTTVREFVLLGTAGLRASRKDRQARLSWALDKVGLADFQERDYWSLSGGQRQRALVARALVRRPRFLLLDEPTNGLDLPAEEALLQSLVHLNEEENLTIVFVTHNLSLAARHATHVAIFLDGSVICGPCSEVLNTECLSRLYPVPTATLKAIIEPWRSLQKASGGQA